MKVIIIGGVAAGAKAAAKIRRLAPDTEINLYTDDDYVSYSSCGLPYYIGGAFEDFRMLLVRTPAEFEKQKIHIHLRHKVIKIMPDTKEVLINVIDKNKNITKPYDKLVIATGARARIPEIINVNLPQVLPLRTLNDGKKLKELTVKSNKAIIIGGGYIGLELIEAFVKRGIHVTMVHNSSHLLTRLDADMSELVYDQLMSISHSRFDILLNENVIEFVGDKNRFYGAKLSSGQFIDGDFAVLATGIIPNSEIALEAGIELGVTKAIKVNEKMETSVKDIYACGDCCEENLIIDNKPTWYPLGSTANKEGRCAAMNVCGISESFGGVLGSAVTRCMDLTVSQTGMSEKTARLRGIEPISVTVTKDDKVGYMPDSNNITLKLTAEKSTGRLIGGQAIGSMDADKRINTLASAILARLTAAEFCMNDLTYAPPFSPTIDPLLNAAMMLRDKIINL
ncbi:FAD-dependent oxidoreductase [bacterium]|nr:FAD-dependent oxidoreductase [bacterium]